MTEDKPKKYDYTSKSRQQRRRQSLNELAQALGFDSWGKLETAAINGDIKIKIEGGTNARTAQ